MVVVGESKPVGGQVEDLSPKGAAPTTGVFTTGRYRFYIGASQLMREPVTVNAWTTLFGVTVNAWTTSTIHSFLGTTFARCATVYACVLVALHGAPLLVMCVMDGRTSNPASVASTCTCP